MQISVHGELKVLDNGDCSGHEASVGETVSSTCKGESLAVKRWPSACSTQQAHTLQHVRTLSVNSLKFGDSRALISAWVRVMHGCYTPSCGVRGRKLPYPPAAHLLSICCAVNAPHHGLQCCVTQHLLHLRLAC